MNNFYFLKSINHFLKFNIYFLLHLSMDKLFGAHAVGCEEKFQIFELEDPDTARPKERHSDQK